MVGTWERSGRYGRPGGGTSWGCSTRRWNGTTPPSAAWRARSPPRSWPGGTSTRSGPVTRWPWSARCTGGLDWGPGDLCWVISNSGRNALVVELALEARRHGVTVVGLVSAEHSGAVSAAPGLPKLPEIADYLLDNGGRFGDAALDIPGVAERMAPTSTIVGAALIHAIWAEVGERLVTRGHAPEVWGSVNRGPV